MSHAFAIPVWLRHRPMVAGLIVPWNTIRDTRGRYLLGAVDHSRNERCLREYRCSVCGRELRADLGWRVVLLLREYSDLPRHGTNEPGMHPQCAHYVTRACPVVAGVRTHMRSQALPLDGTMIAADDAPLRIGQPNEPWWAVWLSTYHLGQIAGQPAALYRPNEVLRIRPVPRHPG